DAFRHLAERKSELVHQHGVGARLLDRCELLASDVLDQTQQKGVAIVRIADDCGNGCVARIARGTPPALAGDDLVAAGSPWAYEQRLDHALAAHRLGEPGARLAVEAFAAPLRVRVNRVD